MATTSWSVVLNTALSGSINFTNQIISLSLDCGKQTFFDDHTGGNITITLRNNTNQCGTISQNDTIILQSVAYFYVTNISFDEGVTDAEATCTITGVDAISQLAQYLVGAGAGASTSPTQQMYNAWQASGIQPPYMDTVRTAVSTVSGNVPNDTTMLNLFNILTTSEMGSLVTDGAQIEAYPYGFFKSSQFTFGRSGTAGIPYYDLVRIKGTDISANNVIVDWQTGQSTYIMPSATYKRTYERYTQLANSLGSSTLAQNQAQFLARTFTDPSTISGQLSWSDKAATTSNNNAWMAAFWVAPQYMATLEYKIPGSSPTSARIKIEGVSCSATPAETNWTVYFSDGSLYDDYILDSASGVLGLARFGWQ